MIKYNGKDIIPRIDGKDISRVMYNGKQIYPTGYDTSEYGIEWQVVNGIAQKPTRIGKLENHITLPIQSQLAACIHDPVTNKIKYWLDPNDSSLKADGTPAIKDGTDGVCRTYVPHFYGRSESDMDEQGLNGTKRVFICLEKKDSTTKYCEIPELVVDSYYSSLDRTNSKLMSVINTSEQFRGGNNSTAYDQYLSSDPFKCLLGKPVTDITRGEARTYANNNNSELLCYEFWKWIFYWLPVIEYCNFNSQEAFNEELTVEGYHQGFLGASLTNVDNWNNFNSYKPITPCGFTDSLGNKTGNKLITSQELQPLNNVYANRYRSIENIFGDIVYFLDGILCQDDKWYVTTDKSLFSDTEDNILLMLAKTLPTDRLSTNYAGDIEIGEEGDIIGINFGSKDSGMYDYMYNYTNSNFLLLRCGGDATYGGNAGLGCYFVNADVASRYSFCGFRTLQRL